MKRRVAVPSIRSFSLMRALQKCTFSALRPVFSLILASYAVAVVLGAAIAAAAAVAGGKGCRMSPRSIYRLARKTPMDAACGLELEDYKFFSPTTICCPRWHFCRGKISRFTADFSLHLPKRERGGPHVQRYGERERGY